MVAGFTAALSVLIAAVIVPGVSVTGFWAALGVALLVAILNALVPPLLAALRLPFMLLLGFLVVLFADAAMLWFASEVLRRAASTVDGFGWAILASLVAAAVGLALEVVLGADDDDTYALRVNHSESRSSSGRATSKRIRPGIVFLEIDGLALPILQRAMRDGNAPGHGALAR